MLFRLFAVALAFLTATIAAAEPQRWEGFVELPGGIKLNFEVSLDNDKSTISIPQQGAKDLALSDVSIAETIKFTLKVPNPAANAVWEFTPAADGKTADGTLKQMGQEFKSSMKALAAGESAKGMNRPQEPKEPFPYKTEEVSIKVEKGGHSLAGVLSVPEGKGPFPGVILVSGSGPQDRDEQLVGHKPFLVLADHLTRKGVAVLRYDDRGVGKSTGDFSTGTSDDFADDALAAITFLAARPEINSKLIGIVGHSEGGLIAPMVSAASPVPTFLVLLAGPGMPGSDLLVLQGRLISEASGTKPEDAARNAEKSRAILEMFRDNKPDTEIRAAILAAIEAELAIEPTTKDKPAEERSKLANQTTTQQMMTMASPWMRRFLQIDPTISLRKVKIPVLALNGEMDLQVPPKENLAGIAKALKAAGNTNVTTQELPGLNHLFQTSKTGAPSEYADLEETFAPAALDAVTAWILDLAANGR